MCYIAHGSGTFLKISSSGYLWSQTVVTDLVPRVRVWHYISTQPAASSISVLTIHMTHSKPPLSVLHSQVLIKRSVGPVCFQLAISFWFS